MKRRSTIQPRTESISSPRNPKMNAADELARSSGAVCGGKRGGSKGGVGGGHGEGCVGGEVSGVEDGVVGTGGTGWGGAGGEVGMEAATLILAATLIVTCCSLSNAASVSTASMGDELESCVVSRRCDWRTHLELYGAIARHRV